MASDAATGDAFGASVMLHDDLAIIGAPGRGPTGASFGAAYVFRRGPSGWIEESVIVASDPQNASAFGDALSFDESLLLIGAPRADRTGAGEGAGYLFDFDGVGWIQRTKIARPLPEAYFGSTVALASPWTVIGTPPSAGPGPSYVYCVAQDSPCIPTLSRWGLLVLMLLIITAGSVRLRRRAAPAAVLLLLMSPTVGVADQCDAAARACCRPDPYNDCIVTTQQCCVAGGGIFNATDLSAVPTVPGVSLLARPVTRRPACRNIDLEPIEESRRIGDDAQVLRHLPGRG
jgi:hypothetical protein